MNDIAILNGNIYLNGKFIEGNLYIKNGMIHEISKAYLSSKEEVDAKGKLVLPGFIDPHVHFQMPAGSRFSEDNFATGSISAAFGGITTIVDFLDEVSTTKQLIDNFHSRKNLAKDSVIDYSFHSAIARPLDTPENFAHTMSQLKIPSIKTFTTYSNHEMDTPESYIYELIKLSAKFNFKVLVHAEDNDLINYDENLVVKDLNNTARPEKAELSEILKLAEMVKKSNGYCYVVHTTCGDVLKELTNKYMDILNSHLFIESCAHYFTFDDSMYLKDNGYLYTMNPPLRSKRQQNLLKEYFNNIDVMATDHCPFPISEKKKQYLNDIPMGVGGVQHSFDLMYHYFGDEVIDKFTINPARIHGLYPYKGTLEPGTYGDVVIYNPNDKHVISIDNSKTNNDYTIYDGIEVNGRVESTILRGQFIVKNGVLTGSKGTGTYIKRNL